MASYSRVLVRSTCVNLSLRCRLLTVKTSLNSCRKLTGQWNAHRHSARTWACCGASGCYIAGQLYRPSSYIDRHQLCLVSELSSVVAWYVTVLRGSQTDACRAGSVGLPRKVEVKCTSGNACVCVAYTALQYKPGNLISYSPTHMLHPKQRSSPIAYERDANAINTCTCASPRPIGQQVRCTIASKFVKIRILLNGVLSCFFLSLC